MKSFNSTREILDVLSETVYLALIFLVPLWFYYGLPNFNIFELNKIILFKVLVLLLLIFTSLRIIFYPPQFVLSVRDFFKRYWLLPTLFIVGLSLTILFSLDPVSSFYGIFERQMGLNSYLFFFLWFILLSFNLLSNPEKKIRRLVATMIISGTLVAIYGLLQIINVDFFTWAEPPHLTRRVFSSFGQPNFLASWLLLIIPLSGYLIYTSRRVLIKIVFILALVAQLICLFFTGSRGGLIALFFALAIFLLYLLIRSSWSRRKKIFMAVSAAIIIIAALISFIFFTGRLNNLRNGSIGARFNFYSAAILAIKNRPLLGYGLETGNKIFIKYYQPDWGVYDNVGASTDRAHNLFLDILLNAGLFGLLLFATLYYFFFSLARKNIKQGKQTTLSFALALAFAAYLFSLLFSFTIVTGEIYFWAFLALLVAINCSGNYREQSNSQGEAVAESSGESSRKNLILVIIKFIIALIIMIFSGLAINKEFRAALADYYFAEIYYFQPAYFTAAVLDDYLLEQKVNPINQETYDRIWSEILVSYYPTIKELTVKKKQTEKIKELDSRLQPRTYKELLVKAKINRILGDTERARSYLNALIKMAPRWPLAYLEAAQLDTAVGDLTAARYDYDQVVANLPDSSDPRLNAAHRRTVLIFQNLISSGRAAINALK